MMTMGSLFDGIGGFPLAAIRNGITPVWASEIEAFPIEVTKIRFPEMLHVGDITKLDGAKLPPVDVICGGSPCQDLSVAGQRRGLAGERSGLFMEQTRIAKEMRKSDEQRNVPAHLVRPRYLVWENVNYALQRIRDVMNGNQLCTHLHKKQRSKHLCACFAVHNNYRFLRFAKIGEPGDEFGIFLPSAWLW